MLKWQKPTFLTDDIWISDGFDMEMPNRTGTYIINEEELTLIDTGPSLSVPFIKMSLEWLNRSLADVTYIIVTHVHLDHAGGAGLLLRECPNANVIIHPRGARHLVDPERLVKGARAVYGEQFDSLFSPVVPISEEKVLVKHHQDSLSFASGRTFTFLDTPGHAKHHFSIVDSKSGGIFTGDTIGIQYEDAKKLGQEIYVPTTSPNQFDPDAMQRSLELIMSYQPTRIFFGHFGASENIAEIKRQLEYWIPIFVSIGKKANDNKASVALAASDIEKEVLSYYSLTDLDAGHSFRSMLKVDASISAMGLLDYFSK
ncbi:MBL fold metallo-hydrolase [Bacillus piscicola]|uniref:MBL fold metallo-hydrolase n=1 Tax=Bacillus piscicola TaxID=1632684 RepID=UPI001F096C96|nr:MBL fold metallo-hydrolase [Bacillus piscicola]